jgi:hypothetical protein
MKVLLKTRLYVGLTALAAAFYTSGCGSDDKKVDPKITISSTGSCVGSDRTYELNEGEQQEFKICGTATKGPDGKKLEKFRITVSYDGGAALAILDTVVGKDGEEAYTFEVTVKTRKATSETGATERYSAIIVDRDGKTASSSFTLTVKKKAGPPPVQKPREITGVTFTNTNAFFVTKDGTAPLDASGGDARKNEIDLTYLYSTSFNTHSFIDPNHRSSTEYDGFGAPATIPFDCPTVTNFFTLNGNPSYDVLKDASQDTLATIVDAGTPSSFTGNPPGKRIQIASGQVFGFKNTTTGKYGIIWVKSLGANSCAVDILVQR